MRYAKKTAMILTQVAKMLGVTKKYLELCIHEGWVSPMEHRLHSDSGQHLLLVAREEVERFMLERRGPGQFFNVRTYNRVVHMRKSRNMSQQKVADILGCSRSTVAMIEKRERDKNDG